MRDYARGGGNSGASVSSLSPNDGSGRLVTPMMLTTSATPDVGAATGGVHEVIDAHGPERCGWWQESFPPSNGARDSWSR